MPLGKFRARFAALVPFLPGVRCPRTPFTIMRFRWEPDALRQERIREVKSNMMLTDAGAGDVVALLESNGVDVPAEAESA